MTFLKSQTCLTPGEQIIISVWSSYLEIADTAHLMISVLISCVHGLFLYELSFILPTDNSHMRLEQVNEQATKDD